MTSIIANLGKSQLDYSIANVKGVDGRLGVRLVVWGLKSTESEITVREK